MTNSSDAAETEDLSSRERIRNAALAQFSAKGFAETTMRSIATEANVAIGLIGHYFGSKEGTREAVEDWIIATFTQALNAADDTAPGGTGDSAARDRMVAQMFEDHPMIVDYLRRELWNINDGSPMISRLARLTAASVDAMRASGHASVEANRVEQVAVVLVRQLGKLFLQPFIDHIVAEFPADQRPDKDPQVSIRVVT